MTRDEYKQVLISKGFKLEKTILAYPGWRGEEDIYTKKPKYKYTFRVFRMFKGKPDYGLYVGIGNQFKSLDAIVEHNLEAEGSKNPLPMWTDEAFEELMKAEEL